MNLRPTYSKANCTWAVRISSSVSIKKSILFVVCTAFFGCTRDCLPPDTMFIDIPDFEVMRLTDTSFLHNEVNWYTNSGEDYLQFTILDWSVLTHVHYWDYVATKGGLSIFHQDNGKRTWKGWYPVNAKCYGALEQILSETDSIGFLPSSDCMFVGPGVFVKIKHGERKMEGTIIGCYQEHIVKLVDWLNEVYPKGDLIYYDKRTNSFLEKGSFGPS